MSDTSAVSALFCGIQVPVLPCRQRPEAMMRVMPGVVLHGVVTVRGKRCELWMKVLETRSNVEDVDNPIIRVADLNDDGSVDYESMNNLTMLDLHKSYNATVDQPDMLNDGWENNPGFVEVRWTDLTKDEVEDDEVEDDEVEVPKKAEYYDDGRDSLSRRMEVVNEPGVFVDVYVGDIIERIATESRMVVSAVLDRQRKDGTQYTELQACSILAKGEGGVPYSRVSDVAIGYFLEGLKKQGWQVYAAETRERFDADGNPIVREEVAEDVVDGNSIADAYDAAVQEGVADEAVEAPKAIGMLKVGDWIEHNGPDGYSVGVVMEAWVFDHRDFVAFEFLQRDGESVDGVRSYCSVESLRQNGWKLIEASREMAKYVEVAAAEAEEREWNAIADAEAEAEIAAETENDKDLLRDMQNLLHDAWDGWGGDEGLADREIIALVGLRVVGTLLRKNQDYGCSVWKAPMLAPDVDPLKAMLCRTSDKIERIATLAAGAQPQVVGEGLKDSILDNAGYSILMLGWILKQEMAKDRRDAAAAAAGNGGAR